MTNIYNRIISEKGQSALFVLRWLREDVVIDGEEDDIVGREGQGQESGLLLSHLGRKDPKVRQ